MPRQRRCDPDVPDKRMDLSWYDDEWMLFAPSKEQRIRLSRRAGGCFALTPSFFCAAYLSFDAFKHLCNSLDSVEIKSGQDASQELSRIMPQPATSSGRLETLPPELTGTIFTFLDTSDFIALALCSQTLWTRAVAWVQSGYLRWRNAYSWAGTPIICAGSNVETLPQPLYDMFPSAVPEPIPEGVQSDEERRTGPHNRPRVWFDEAAERYEKRPIPYDDAYREEFSERIGSAGIPEEFHKPMAASFPTFSVELGSKWYLRNRTLREYIRMEGIVTADGEVTVCFVGNHWLTLDILVTWLISWRGEPDSQVCSWERLKLFRGLTDSGIGDIMVDPTYGPLDDSFWPIWDGNWAGHSLDVVAEEVDEGWVDQSSTIDLISDGMMRTFYGLAMAEVGLEEEKYWEKIYKDSGAVADLGTTGSVGDWSPTSPEYGPEYYGSGHQSRLVQDLGRDARQDERGKYNMPHFLAIYMLVNLWLTQRPLTRTACTNPMFQHDFLSPGRDFMQSSLLFGGYFSFASVRLRLFEMFLATINTLDI
ncbi:hypothetical protein FDECE_14041 [Fusarium decemcellulare]|nr:hypothetical protein FDECE_14041 [Fusarium decemcellulare]